MFKTSLKFIVRVYQRFRRILVPNLHKPYYNLPYEYHGSDYGGWPVLVDSLNSQSCVYSFGVGTDISFNLSLIAKYGCKVKAFDPTPRCVDWIMQVKTPEQFIFFSVGLSDCTQTLHFSAPLETSHVSYTAGVSGTATEVVALPVQALDEIMKAQGDSKIDFIKMDIEGAEYDVLQDMIFKGIFPEQLCVEFHHGMYGYTAAQTLSAVDALEKVGYKLYFVSKVGREYGFCRLRSDLIS